MRVRRGKGYEVMRIKGLQKLTLLDFPGKIGATVFLGGCNFRCPFCHNASLVIPEREGDLISIEEFFAFLDKRRGMLEGVCISGGEPTLCPELPTFIKEIRARGYAVKLDTNGYRPEVLSSLIDSGLLDYVAMDIKNSKEKYRETAGLPSLDISKIEKSVELLKEGKVPFEFRTTVVRELHTEEDIRSICRWLGEGVSLFLQPFSDSGDIIEEGMSGYSVAEMDELLKIAREFVPLAQIRG